MDERTKKKISYITGYTVFLLVSLTVLLAGCGNDADANFAETTEIAEKMEKVESDEESIKNDEVYITHRESEDEKKEEEISDEPESIDADSYADLTPAEVYELFLNGEFTVGLKVARTYEWEPNEIQVTIDELFWGNDIEYCFGDIDGDGTEELHIRDDVVYYAIKAVDGTLQILFEGRWGYEPIVTDEVCGILYHSYGYGSEHIEIITISADGSTESDGEFRWHDQNKNGGMDEEDSFDIDYVKDINMEQYVQYKEEQIAKQKETELEWTDKRLKDFATWQEAYIDYINKPESTIWTSKNGSDYSLIYVDDDDIPELYIHTGIMATGTFIVSFYDGNVRAMNRERGGIEYMEYGGLLYSNWGNSGFDPFNVYMLEKGEFSEIGTGWDHWVNLFDDAEPQFEYFWEGNQVTKTEYEACISKLIDTTQCVEPAELYTQDEMLEILAEWD